MEFMDAISLCAGQRNMMYQTLEDIVCGFAQKKPQGANTKPNDQIEIRQLKKVVPEKGDVKTSVIQGK